jgi:hypothetical protein
MDFINKIRETHGKEISKRLKRFSANERINNKRTSIAKKYNINTEKNWLKHHPLDCGCTNCHMCASPRNRGYGKEKDRLTIKERVFVETCKEDLVDFGLYDMAKKINVYQFASKSYL